MVIISDYVVEHKLNQKAYFFHIIKHNHNAADVKWLDKNRYSFPINQ
jgi:hypothetical protein